MRRNLRHLSGKVQSIFGIDPLEILKGRETLVDIIVKQIGQNVETTISELSKSVVNKNKWTKMEDQVGFLRNLPNVREIFNEGYKTACDDVKKAQKNVAELEDGGDLSTLQEAVDKAERNLFKHIERLAVIIEDPETLVNTIMNTERSRNLGIIVNPLQTNKSQGPVS